MRSFFIRGITIGLFLATLTAMGLAFGVGHSFAAEPDPWGINPTKCNFTSGSGLLNLDGSGIFRVVEQETCAGLLADYMVAMINFFFRLAIVLAVLMVAIGGFQWLMAVGNSSKISNAKDTIQQAIIGLILALTATLLFSQIDTTFTEFDKNQFDLRGPLATVNCLEYEPSRYHQEFFAEGSTTVTPDVTKNATEKARTECEAHNPPCEWDTDQKRCFLAAGSQADARQCSAPVYNDGCTESGPLVEIKTCVSGKAQPAGVDLGDITTTGGTHSEFSCHFGGHSCRGGHAIDYGNEDAAAAIFQMVQQCKQERGISDARCYCEDAAGNRYSDCANSAVNHIHCNVDTAGCGCN